MPVLLMLRYHWIRNFSIFWKQNHEVSELNSLQGETDTEMYMKCLDNCFYCRFKRQTFYQ